MLSNICFLDSSCFFQIVFFNKKSNTKNSKPTVFSVRVKSVLQSMESCLSHNVTHMRKFDLRKITLNISNKMFKVVKGHRKK